MWDITTMGEILIDLTQAGEDSQGIPLLAAVPGGAPANVAVAAARLGARCSFVGKVGQDGLGGYLRRVLEDNGVDTSGLTAGEEATTMAVVALTPAGERSFRFLRGADRALTWEEVPQGVLEGTRMFHFGSVSLTEDPARTAVLRAAGRARALGKLVSYDPNYRAPLWRSGEEARRRMLEPLPLVDLLKVSREELPLLSGTEDLEEGTARLAEAGPRLVLVTLGAEGAFYRWRGRTGRVPGVPVAVADTNGAGDSFLGAVLSRLARRGEHPLEALEVGELEEILAFANRAAALTCSRRGAIPAMPTVTELEGDHP